MKILINANAVTKGDIDFTEFEKCGEVTYFGELSRAELFSLAKDFEAIIVNKTEVDKELLGYCPKLKYVGLFATGYNSVDIAACRARGITVCNVPDYSTRAVSQHAFALLLNLLGRINEYTSSVRRGDWIKSETFSYFPWDMAELNGKTFGIYG